MIGFKTAQPKLLTFVFKNLLFTLGIIAVILIIVKLFFPQRLNVFLFMFISAMLLSRLISDLLTNRLQEINFDTEKRQIVFYFRNAFSGVLHTTLSFDEARLETVGGDKPVILYFLKNKTEIFEIKESKDAYPPDSLRAIADTVKQLSLSVSV